VIRRTAELVADARAELGEGPRWDDEAEVLDWLDVAQGRWHRTAPDGRAVGSRRLGERVSCLRPRRRGGRLAAVDGAVVLLDGNGDEQRRWSLGLAPGAVLNDGGCDAAGRLVVGSVAPDPGDGALHRVDPDGTVSTLRTGVAMSNGLDWSPDGRVLYHVDSAAGTVTALDYSGADGTVGAARVLIRVPVAEGLPDGLAVDADGALWVAIWGGGEVRRYAPDGRLDGRVAVPVSQVTSCALGGGRLWITTAHQGLAPVARAREPLAGGLFACDVESVPTPPQRFAG
jgi:sugar lactone lactonase YvrE